MPLSDGDNWLFAVPRFSLGLGSVTTPDVDRLLNRLFDCLVMCEPLPLTDVMEAAAILLRANYHLTDAELSDLLEVDVGGECDRLVAHVIEALFGPERPTRTYVDWIRASLAANGLGDRGITAGDLPNVITVLTSTNRTVPASRFVDSCAAAIEQERLEALV